MTNNTLTKIPMNPLKRVFWRYFFLFFLFYIVPDDLGHGFTNDFFDLPFWDKPVVWLGENLLNWKFDLENLYRGYDSKYQLSKVILLLILAVICTSIWLFIDKLVKKEYDNFLKIFFQTILRYHIAIIMMSYGLAKVFMLQFGTIDIDTMESKIGDAGGMSFMWNFMSYSKLVVMFSGWIELIGAILLFFRKTTFLGAIMLFGVMLGVVVMDIGYDVSVTIYAMFLFLMILILLSSQFKSLLSFIVLNKSSSPEPYIHLFRDNKFKKWALGLKVLILLLVVYLHTTEQIETYNMQNTNKNAWFSGKHTVETFVLNNDTISIQDTDNPKLWKKITFNGTSYLPESFVITKVNKNERNERFNFEIDSTAGTISYKPFISRYESRNDKEPDSVIAWNIFSYKKMDDKKYVIEGIYNEDTIQVTTKIKLFEDYTLIKRKGNFLFDLE